MYKRHREENSSDYFNREPIKRIRNMTEDEESQDSNMSNISNMAANPFKHLFGESSNKKVYADGRHIYFRDGVSKTSVDELIKIINKLNKKFTDMKSNVDFANITPLPLILHITSEGGNCLMGFLAADHIANSKIPIYTIVEGYAFSAATFMSVVGKKRYITKNSMVLIHQITSTMYGRYTHENMKDEIENGEIIMKKLSDMYIANTNGKMKKKYIREVLKKDLYFDAEKSIKLGLVDSIYTNDDNDLI
jgi:ATP-dependent protease ClpP protease subunit